MDERAGIEKEKEKREYDRETRVVRAGSFDQG